MFVTIPRSLSSHILELARFYPAVSITGPRQAGKTTLAQTLFPEYRYVNFEDIRQRNRFQEDPLGFLAEYDERVIFDEAQRVPELFNYLLVVIDERRTPGRFVLTGSQNFLAVKQITQSLAGRVGIARLLPLDFAELPTAELAAAGPAETMLRGFYPGPYQSGIPTDIFYSDYLASYLERDVTHLIRQSNMLDYRRFLTLVVSMIGQPLNFSALAGSLRVSVNTVKQWVHYLGQTYIAFLVSPYFTNTGKRVAKQPKLFFYDTGLACFLSGLKDVAALKASPQYGSLFENLIMADIRKQRYHRGDLSDFAFFRDERQREVDFIDAAINPKWVMEIKSSGSPRPGHVTTAKKVHQIMGKDLRLTLTYGGKESGVVDGVPVNPWYDWAGKERDD